jgi:flavin reductase (DIM6/NTAB) family NADH-FMN oxidoreductase RutF
VTIHSAHPFRNPEPDHARRLRGRLGGAVTLWTSGRLAEEPAGLTVSSLLVATGRPAYVVALLDPDSDLSERLTETGRAMVHVLQWRHRDLAEVFAGLAPAPGGTFAQDEFLDTEWGPRLTSAGTWAGVALRDTRTLGWSAEVVCELEDCIIADDEEQPLVHHRGRYRRPSDPQRRPS